MEKDEQKNEFYRKYRSTHVNSVDSFNDAKDLENNFFVFDKYYQKFLPNNKGIQILDIACGSGDIIYWLNKKGYKDVVGVDISQEQVDKSASIGVSVVKNDFREYVNPINNEFDIIFAIDILEHFSKEEILNILKMLYKALKPSGKIIIKTINAESLFGSRLLYSDFTHETAFTKRSLKQIISVAGFKTVEFSEAGPVVHNIKSLIRKILWILLRSLINLFFIIENGSRQKILTQNIIAVAQK